MKEFKLKIQSDLTKKILYQFTIIVNADKGLNRKKLKQKLYGGDNTKQTNALFSFWSLEKLK